MVVHQHSAGKIAQKFAVFDIDGTLFRANLTATLLLSLIDKGLINKKVLTEITPHYLAWKNRERPEAFIQYDEHLVELLSTNIHGIPHAEIIKIIPSMVEEIHKKTYVYTRNLIAKLKNEGYVLVAITTSLREVAQPFVDHYGFDILKANIIRCNRQGICQSTTPVIRNKEMVLRTLTRDRGLIMKDSYAIGDTLSDANMLKLVKHPIAFNPSFELFEVAKHKGWSVVVERKNIVYRLDAKSTEAFHHHELSHDNHPVLSHK